MFKRNRWLRILAYALTGVALLGGTSILISLLLNWLIPDRDARVIVSALAGIPIGWLVGGVLMHRYSERYW